MKKLFLLLALGLIGLNACRQSSPGEIAPEAPAEKLPTSKVLITYTGEIKDGDWIEIDGLPRMYHLVDTMNPIRLPGEPARFERRSVYPTLSPTPDVENLWISQGYILGSMTGRWWPDRKSNGLPPASLFYYLTLREQKAGAYSADNRQYIASFEGISATEWQRISEPLIMSMEAAYNRLTRLRLERTDGQPIRIRTSEGYAAKVEYQ
jgi:hypothetical protein